METRRVVVYNGSAHLTPTGTQNKSVNGQDRTHILRIQNRMWWTAIILTTDTSRHVTVLQQENKCTSCVQKWTADKMQETKITQRRPVASLLITGGGRFPQNLDLFMGLKIVVPSGCLGESSICKIIMTDDITLWSKLESTS